MKDFVAVEHAEPSFIPDLELVSVKKDGVLTIIPESERLQALAAARSQLVFFYFVSRRKDQNILLSFPALFSEFLPFFLCLYVDDDPHRAALASERFKCSRILSATIVQVFVQCNFHGGLHRPGIAPLCFLLLASR